MKRIYIGIAVAAGLMLSACEAIESPVVLEPSDEVVSPQDPSADGEDGFIFTASLGTDTKTYTEYDPTWGIYKLLWSENDQIIIWDADTMDPEEQGLYEFCSILNGAGTAYAEFVGKMEAATYVALYANSYFYPEDGLPCIGLSDYQYYSRPDGIQDHMYPMIAVSDSRNFEFQNICSILKFNITGNGELLDHMVISSGNGEPLAGKATVGFDEVFEPYLMFSESYYSEITYDCAQYLSDTPIECYVVVPAQLYEGGLDITLFTDHGVMEVSTAPGIQPKRSQIHEVPVDFVVERTLAEEVSGEYAVTGTYYGGNYAEWTLTITPDEYEGNKVWIDCVTYFSKEAHEQGWGDFGVYAYVSSGLSTLTLPCGQMCGANSDTPAWVQDENDVFELWTWEFTEDGGIAFGSAESVTFYNNRAGGWYTYDAPFVLSVNSYSLYAAALMDAGSMVLTRIEPEVDESFSATIEGVETR